MSKLRRASDWPFPPTGDVDQMVGPVYGDIEGTVETIKFRDNVNTYVSIPEPVDYSTVVPTVTGEHGLFMPDQLPKNMQKVESDPTGKQPHEPGAKLDTGKLKGWLFFSGFANALEEVAKVTTLGAEKYTPNGWATVPDGEARYMEAAIRHLFAMGKGAVFDDGPGGLGSTYHKAQVIWNLLASLELELRNKT